MTEDEIKKLITDTVQASIAPALKSGLEQFSNHFKEQIAPIAARLDEFEAVITEPEPPVAAKGDKQLTPEESALTERLAKLEKLEAERVAELRQMKLDNALSATISKHSPLHADFVKESLAAKYASQAVEKNGEWYLPNGSKLSEEIDSFFSSEAGQHFIPNPSGAALGTQTAKQPQAPQKSFKDLSAEDMLAEMVFV